ncbi:tetratricopeptide repeat protein [Nitrosovibrio sp. Nv6]|uniref:tetratricopeptide repeat protein n=1 Tax=Nitrosovibrio sp. Nv6 TaxID=1855340 RepID=UPI0008CC534D|nr:tetratricopeptide repeat protein [Nitrosovibrio sp. Nv6]SEP43812.1 Tfp pilus assembly protein PilF [Nitrosovibrio sp. Nv6]
MEEIAGFKEIAPYLTNPLVLVGFVLVLFFGIHRLLLKAGILPPLTPHTGGKVVQTFLRYGFVIALVVIALGSVYAFYQAYLQHDPNFQERQAKAEHSRHQVEVVKSACPNENWRLFDEATRRVMAGACKQAIDAIPQLNASEPEKEEALARLEKGDTQGAKDLFQAVLERKSAEGKASNREAAEAARHLGALVVLDDPLEGIAKYRKAVELDPDNLEGWSELGRLLTAIGKWNDAEAVYEKFKAHAQSQGDQKWLARAYEGLGLMYQFRGNLTQAEKMYGQALAMFKQALAIYEELGRKEDMAHAYENLGIVYQRRGELAQAEKKYREALSIYEKLGRKEDEAYAHENLGDVYQSRGELAQAEKKYREALSIYEKLGDKRGIAYAYVTFGWLYSDQGDLTKAEKMYRDALVIFDELGHKVGMVEAYLGLENVYQTRGELAQAEAMSTQVHRIAESMGNRLGTLYTYTRLALAYQMFGDLTQAETMYRKSIGLFRELGMTVYVQLFQEKLDAIAKQRRCRADPFDCPILTLP